MAKQAVNRQQQAQMEAAIRRERKNLEQQVEDLELKARYWKAQLEIRQFTLEAEKLQPDYDLYMEEQRKKNEELRAKYEEAMKELQEKAETKDETVQ